MWEASGESVGGSTKSGQLHKGRPEPVRVHDFAIPELGKAVPYGIYDVSANAGFVNVGISADTREFSVASIRRWCCEIGAPRYPNAKQLLIKAFDDYWMHYVD